MINSYIPINGFQFNKKPKCWLVVDDDYVYFSDENTLLWTNIPRSFENIGFSIGLVDEEVVGVIYQSLLMDSNRKKSIKAVFAENDLNTSYLINHGFQLAQFYQNQRFCSSCGSRCLPRVGEWCVKCESCSRVFYPNISPCIIVLVYQQNEILLVLHQRHQKMQKSLFTCIAGHVDVGETIENTVKREVLEETGLVIKQPEYYLSQSWPFPNLLMLGFYAEYESGTIQLEDKELVDAKWYKVDHLPSLLPTKNTISRQLIDQFITYKNS